MTDQPLLLALDQGTSSSRAALFNSSGDLVVSASAPLSIDYPADGWVEQDPLDIWGSQRQAMRDLAAALTPEQRKAVVSCGITNQRDDGAWRRSTGQPVSGAGLAGRTHGRHLRNGHTRAAEDGVTDRLLLDPYFGASKIRWMLSNHDEAARAAAR